MKRDFIRTIICNQDNFVRLIVFVCSNILGWLFYLSFQTVIFDSYEIWKLKSGKKKASAGIIKAQEEQPQDANEPAAPTPMPTGGEAAPDIKPVEIAIAPELHEKNRASYEDRQKQEEAEKIIAYLAQVGGETDYLSFGKEGLTISTEEEEKFIQNINKEEHSVLYVVWKNGEIIGDASLSGFSRRMSHRAEFGISVVKSEWGQGIGRALLQKCIMYAKEHMIELINLEVRSDNIRAIHVYEKYGFRKIGTSPAYFKIDGEYYDFDLMVLDLRRERQ